MTADSTLDDLKAFVQTSIPGSSVAIGTGGRLQVTSGVGTDQEATALSLTTGGAAALFDATFASSTSTRAATGLGTIQADDTLHLTVGSLSYDVAVKAGWSMDRVAAEINAANGGISAATAGGRLRLNGVETGATNVISVSSTGTTAADLGLVHAGTAQDAIVNVDGQDVTTSSNTTTDVIPGATMTLLATSTTATSATTDPKFIDPDEATNRVQKMVDAYNQVMLAIDGQVTEKHVVNAKTSADKLSGVLFGDSTLNGIRATMQNAMADLVGGIAVGKNIAKSIGLGTAAFDQNAGAGSLDGQLQFDAATFKKALADDPDSVKILLTNDGTTRTSDGLAQRLSDLATSYTSTNGGLKAKIDGSDDEIKRINEQIDRMQARIDAERTRLTTQFTAMETAMSQLKSSQAQMQSQLSSLG